MEWVLGQGRGWWSACLKARRNILSLPTSPAAGCHSPSTSSRLYRPFLIYFLSFFSPFSVSRSGHFSHFMLSVFPWCFLFCSCLYELVFPFYLPFAFWQEEMHDRLVRQSLTSHIPDLPDYPDSEPRRVTALQRCRPVCPVHLALRVHSLLFWPFCFACITGLIRALIAALRPPGKLNC